MRADTIQRKLRALDVPVAKARAAANRYGDDAGTPTDLQKLQRELARAARRKLLEQHRREFRAWCKGNDLPIPTHEHRFAVESHGRMWAFDWAWRDPDGAGVALEIEGGIYSNGRHVRGKGYEEDALKYSTAATLGWKLIRVTWSTLYTDTTLALLRAALSPETPA